AGRGPATAHDAQNGAIFGALAGLVVASLNDNNQSLWKYPLIGTLGMIAGAGVGAVVGSTRRVEQWRAAPIPTSAPASAVAPAPVTIRARVDAPHSLGATPRTGTLLSRSAD